MAYSLCNIIVTYEQYVSAIDQKTIVPSITW